MTSRRTACRCGSSPVCAGHRLGTYIGGWRVIRTLGKGLVEIEAPQGLSKDASVAIILTSSVAGMVVDDPRGHRLDSGQRRGASRAPRCAGRCLPDGGRLAGSPCRWPGWAGALTFWIGHGIDGEFRVGRQHRDLRDPGRSVRIHVVAGPAAQGRPFQRDRRLMRRRTPWCPPMSAKRRGSAGSRREGDAMMHYLDGLAACCWWVWSWALGCPRSFAIGALTYLGRWRR